MLADCLARNAERTGKDRVRDVGLFATAKALVRPTRAEGFDPLFYVACEADGEFTMSAWFEEVVGGYGLRAEPEMLSETDRTRPVASRVPERIQTRNASDPGYERGTSPFGDVFTICAQLIGMGTDMPESLESSEGRFEVTALGVGHGDAILLTWSAGDNVWNCLIDGGESPDRLNSELARRGVSRIDLLVLSHFDNDHVGGLLGLSPGISIGEYWGPATPAYLRHLWIFGPRCREAIERTKRLEKALRARKVRVSYPLEGYRSAPNSPAGPRIEVLSPPARLVETLLTSDDVNWLFASPQTPLGWMLVPEPPDPDPTAPRLALLERLSRGVLSPEDISGRAYRQSPQTTTPEAFAASSGTEPEFFGDSVINNSSLVLWVEFDVGTRTHRLLLPGDQENWSYLCGRNPRGLQADLLKAPHHGGRVYLERVAAYDALMKTVRPRSVLVSACGRHGLPRAQFRDAASAWGATVFCTSVRGRERVLAQIETDDGESRCCHTENECSSETEDVTIRFDAAGVAGCRPACHSGWGGDSGPVIQLQQHLIAPSPIGQRLLEHELSRHLDWIKKTLRGIARERREKSDGAGEGYQPIPGTDIAASARAANPPRNDLVANLSSILVEGMNRRAFWVDDLSPHARDRSAYAWPTMKDVARIHRVLREGPPLLFRLPEKYRQLDVPTLVSRLDTSRFEVLCERRLCLPRGAFEDTIWPHLRQSLIRRWHGFKMRADHLLLVPEKTATPKLQTILDLHYDASAGNLIPNIDHNPDFWLLLCDDHRCHTAWTELSDLLLANTPLEALDATWADVREAWQDMLREERSKMQLLHDTACNLCLKHTSRGPEHLEAIRAQASLPLVPHYATKAETLVFRTARALAQFDTKSQWRTIPFTDLHRMVNGNHERLAALRCSQFEELW